MPDNIRWFNTLGIQDVPLVGGKNASLGEMLQNLGAQGISVPDGFATTAQAYREFLRFNHLEDRIQALLAQFKEREISLEQTGKSIRALFLHTQFPMQFIEELNHAYHQLSRQYNQEWADVAVRSSATAEDLPQASFAGQQETFLHIQGEAELLEACRRCYASLFTDRAIVYRQEHGFDHLAVAVSVGVQKMVRSDLGCAGVMFTLDTENGFPDVVGINAAWGLGENVVQGTVTPDEYTIFKPLLKQPENRPIIRKQLGKKEQKMVYSDGHFQTTQNVPVLPEDRARYVLSDDEAIQLARWACTIEAHYGRPMDIEWARDGQTGQFHILQARPETVQSRQGDNHLRTYTLEASSRVLLEGVSVGQTIAAGRVCRIEDVSQRRHFVAGSILVTHTTDPDWVPIMRQAQGIITDTGGRTCHAAIVSRELGIPAIVGTGRATSLLHEDQEITLSCAQGDRGFVYEGLLPFRTEELDPARLPKTRTQLMLNLADPDAALHWWRLPTQGVGLARIEFIISNTIRIHPMALVHFADIRNPELRHQIQELTREYPDKPAFFVARLAEGIARIAASQYPHPVIVRMSDFKTNEYANLIGGQLFEPQEENPMLGFRGASRYYSDQYRDGFALECQAIRQVRETMGFQNVVVMIPFCRTPQEADKVLAIMAENGLKRGEQGLEIYVMCEIPSNVILAEEFAQRFDGFSIGSNDLTQLVLGVDRDSALLAPLFDERNEAVKSLIRHVIQVAHNQGIKVGICGQAPSDYPDFADFLVEAGIDSISLNPDSFVTTGYRVAVAEARLERSRQSPVPLL